MSIYLWFSAKMNTDKEMRSRTKLVHLINRSTVEKAKAKTSASSAHNTNNNEKINKFSTYFFLTGIKLYCTLHLVIRLLMFAFRVFQPSGFSDARLLFPVPLLFNDHTRFLFTASLLQFTLHKAKIWFY